MNGEEEKTRNNQVWIPPAARQSRFDAVLLESEAVISHELLMANKKRKQLLIAGAELFNNRPSKGIQFLQENSILSNPLDPQQVNKLIHLASFSFSVYFTVCSFFSLLIKLLVY